MEYKVGDRVRLKNVRGSGWVWAMDIYLGKVVTIDKIIGHTFVVDGWRFSISDIESKILDIDGSNLEKLKEQYNKMGETIKQLEKEKEKTIYVPDCINIISPVLSPHILGLVNDEGYMLWYILNKNGYGIQKLNINEQRKYKLVKTTWGELNPGDICYGNNNLMRIDELSEYGIKLKDGSRQSWYDKDCVNDDDLYLTDTIVYKIVLA